MIEIGDVVHFSRSVPNDLLIGSICIIVDIERTPIESYTGRYAPNGFDAVHYLSERIKKEWIDER
jgi:hypothetical protein